MCDRCPTSGDGAPRGIPGFPVWLIDVRPRRGAETGTGGLSDCVDRLGWEFVGCMVDGGSIAGGQDAAEDGDAESSAELAGDVVQGHTDRVDIKVMLRVTRVAITGLVMSMLGLSACVDDTMTNRLEETYGIADFEIEGAERYRTEHNRVSTREGPTGTTQRLEPLGETELDDILASALAATEADGSEMQPPAEGAGVNLWIGYQPLADTDRCDVLSVDQIARRFSSRVLILVERPLREIKHDVDSIALSRGDWSSWQVPLIVDSDQSTGPAHDDGATRDQRVIATRDHQRSALLPAKCGTSGC